MVRQCRLSVPAKLIGRRARVLMRATKVLLFDGAKQVATHPRCTVRDGEVCYGLDQLFGGPRPQTRRAGCVYGLGTGPQQPVCKPYRVRGERPQNDDSASRLGEAPPSFTTSGTGSNENDPN